MLNDFQICSVLISLNIQDHILLSDATSNYQKAIKSKTISYFKKIFHISKKQIG